MSSSNPLKVELHAPNLSRVILAPAQYPFHEERWSVAFQALDEGWQELALSGVPNSGRPFYVSGENEWNALQRARKIKSNDRWIQERKQQISKIFCVLSLHQSKPFRQWRIKYRGGRLRLRMLRQQPSRFGKITEFRMRSSVC